MKESFLDGISKCLGRLALRRQSAAGALTRVIESERENIKLLRLAQREIADNMVTLLEVEDGRVIELSKRSIVKDLNIAGLEATKEIADSEIRIAALEQAVESMLPGYLEAAFPRNRAKN